MTEQHNPIKQQLHQAFNLQRESFLNSHHETRQERKLHLSNLKRLLTENREAIVDAICQDYGNRSKFETLFAEIVVVTDDINSAIKKLRKWMKVQHRHVDKTIYFGAKTVLFHNP